MKFWHLKFKLVASYVAMQNNQLVASFLNIDAMHILIVLFYDHCVEFDTNGCAILL